MNISIIFGKSVNFATLLVWFIIEISSTKRLITPFPPEDVATPFHAFYTLPDIRPASRKPSLQALKNARDIRWKVNTAKKQRLEWWKLPSMGWKLPSTLQQQSKLLRWETHSGVFQSEKREICQRYWVCISRPTLKTD